MEHMSGMKRIVALDSIRGIAAFAVVLHHCSLALPELREKIEATYVLRPLVAGPAAVYVFFVLSGFVPLRNAQLGFGSTLLELRGQEISSTLAAPRRRGDLFGSAIYARRAWQRFGRKFVV